jgi:hypothetical protein
MKLTVINILIILLLIASACQRKKENTDHEHAGIQTDTTKKSIPQEEHAQVGNAHVTLKYYAPAVRSRTIWGGLVPYGEVWVTGAHSATAFEIDKNFIIGEKEIPAGKYALFTIPNVDTWTIIINKNWNQHLADDYDEKEDMIRLEVQPEPLQNLQERLKYTIIVESETNATVSICWEKIKVSFPFKIK